MGLLRLDKSGLAMTVVTISADSVRHFNIKLLLHKSGNCQEVP
jgi:hypothetical protein